MILMWGAYFATGTMMGIKPAAAGLSFHIAAEFATAAVMIAGGAGVLKGKGWGRDFYFLGIGMLLYALINSPGYYLSGRAALILAMFGGTLVLALIFAVLGLKSLASER